MSCHETELEEPKTFIAKPQIAVKPSEALLMELGIKQDVPLQGFYKDVFMDAGMSLTTRNTLPAATYLGFSLESVSCSEVIDTLLQVMLMTLTAVCFILTDNRVIGSFLYVVEVPVHMVNHCVLLV